MDKEIITRELQAITNELTLSNKQHEIKNCIKDDNFEMTFDHFCWGEPAKIRTKIIMQKIPVDTHPTKS